MGWTTPTQRNTGDLITASIWNTDLKDNLRYLKGMDGQITVEDDMIPNTGSLTLGDSSNPWLEGHFGEGRFVTLYANRFSVHQSLRTVILNWPNADLGEEQVTAVEAAANSTIAADGMGQLVITVDDNQPTYAYARPTAESAGLDNSFNASRSPYFRQEFAVNQNVSNTGIFLGMRQTPGQALPNYASEHFFGLVWNGTIWYFQTGNSSSQDVSGSQSISTDTRYVIEMLLISGSEVECYLNGSLIDTLTVVPTGDLEWSVLMESDGGGGATQTDFTVGMAILQEDLS